jgi:hypothetical protein
VDAARLDRLRTPAWSVRGSDLYAVRPSGRGLHRLCRAQTVQRPAASPDGSEIAFLDYRPTDVNLWQLRVAPGCRRIGTATAEWTLAWSRDATRLLWEDEGERLVVGRADGGGEPRFLTRGSGADWR